ncbi:hypothetical protein [Peribacillus simplex]|nr:hypothetical protein [Peribacillus simplex]
MSKNNDYRMEEELDRTELREQKERYRFVDRIEFADGATSKKKAISL